MTAAIEGFQAGGMWLLRLPPRLVGFQIAAVPNRFLLGDCQIQGEVEYAPLLGNAIHPDPPAHHLHQASADGEAETRPSILTGHRAIGLRKSGKYFFLYFLWYPDASIFHSEVKEHASFGGKRGCNGYQNLAALGEFNCIAK